MQLACLNDIYNVEYEYIQYITQFFQSNKNLGIYLIPVH